MAMIKSILSNEATILQTQSRFGRNKKSSTIHIAENDISQSHAIIEWKNGDWFLQDYSRNGTLISTKYIHYSSTKLKVGDIIQFGRSESTKFKVINLSPPSSYLMSLTNPEVIMELTNYHKIYNDKGNDVLIYYSNEMFWKAETISSTIKFEHGKSYQINDEHWLFIENEPLNNTVDTRNVVNHAQFLFTVSEDEEHIRLKIAINDIELDLGDRAHHHFLLILARKKISDDNNPSLTNNYGWMDVDDLVRQVSKELYKEVDEYYLNLLIHRFRKQLFGLEPYGYLFSDVIKRKKGKICFAHPFFNISKEEQPVEKLLVNTGSSV